MRHRQFPVRIAFAMTMNKSQGQSLRKVGMDLRNPVFSHGQLYVTLSWGTNKSGVKALLPEGSNGRTTNIVYKEALLKSVSFFIIIRIWLTDIIFRPDRLWYLTWLCFYDSCTVFFWFWFWLMLT